MNSTAVLSRRSSVLPLFAPGELEDLQPCYAQIGAGDVIKGNRGGYTLMQKLGSGVESSGWLVERTSPKESRTLGIKLVAKVLTQEATLRAKIEDNAEVILNSVMAHLHQTRDIAARQEDIKADNVVVPLLSREEKDAFFKHLDTVGSPPYLQLPRCQVPNIKVQLSDFTSAIKVTSDSTSGKAMPRATRAPEVILGRRWGQPVDVWALGCLVMELLLPTHLFFPNSCPYDNEIADFAHLAQMIELFGPFSVESLSKCPEAERNKFFLPNGSLKPVDQFLAESFARCDQETRSMFFHSDASLKNSDLMQPSRRGGLRKLLEDVGLRGTELDEVHGFVGRMLTFDPDDRSTTSQLQEDPIVAKFDLRTNGFKIE
ncbi:kinase-like domain-containing protein [Epithele typhae]|uniref:kinase-like domain-containing protein n=1 Tax=Epithele typhae TaxID=378194 RepID=UPI002008B8F0|nr:kinase-like domain-containing protein [Epithele typhae]KAH9939734.1 kinase-like domain-containing protein [Epithele typhae]